MAGILVRASLQASVLLLSACLGVAQLGAADRDNDRAAWTIEQGTDRPSYAMVEPASSNVNIDVVVLACEHADGIRFLQLQLYLTDDGPLQPKYRPALPLKTAPRAVITIDGRSLPVDLLFADDYAVLADSREGWFPSLSDRLVTAMQAGMEMTVYFDLWEEPAGELPAFDGQAVVDLQGPGGREAIVAMRRCAGRESDLQALVQR
jgi:hypothetical protein